MKRLHLLLRFDMMDSLTLHPIWVVAGSILGTVPIVSACSLYFHGVVTLDYLITGLIASTIVASFAIGLLNYADARALSLVRDSEERFRALADVAGDLIFTVDVNGKVGYVNETAARALHTAPEQVVGKNLRDLFPPENFERQWCNLQKVFKTDAPLYVEELNCFPHGEVWQSTWLTPLRHTSGSAITVLGASRDITGRKQMELSLRESEERFRKSFQHAAIGMALVGLDGRWLQVNLALCRIVGYTEPELLSKTFQDITHPDDLQTNLDFVAQLLAGEADHYQMEKRYFHQDGHVVWIRLSVALIKDAQDNPLHFVSQIEDITRDKQAEAALRDSEEQYRTMVENSNDMIWTLTADGRFTFINQQAADVTGRSIADWLGKTFEPLVMEEDLPMALEIHGKVMSGEKIHYEVRVKKTDGGILTLSVNSSPIFKDGKVSGTISFASDITERKQAEETLRSAHEDLLKKSGRLEMFQRVAVDREMRMVEMKDEVNGLLERLGEPRKYVEIDDIRIR